MSGIDICRYANFSGTVPPVTENMPLKDKNPIITIIKAIRPETSKIFLYNFSLLLHLIKFSPNSIPQTGKTSQLTYAL